MQSNAECIETEYKPAALKNVRLKSGLSRIYAFSQVHCDLSDLKVIDGKIAEDSKEYPSEELAVIHAGGLIDKGTSLPNLMQYLRNRPELGVSSITYLKGAHEDLFVKSLKGDSRAAFHWLLSGAEGSLDRWGVPTQDWVAALSRVIPPEDIAFLTGLPGSVTFDRTTFVCSTFTSAQARPFGLFGSPIDTKALFGDGPVDPIGRHSLLMRGQAPDGWRIADTWISGRLSCAVLKRNL